MAAIDTDIRLAERADVTVLITGDRDATEEIARGLHDRGRRRQGPFLIISCGQLTNAWLDTAVFGQQPDDPVAPVELIHHASLLLRDIGELDLDHQERLRRFLLRRRLRTANDSKAEIDVRVIATTVDPLFDRVRAQQFREDLYYQLNAIHIRIVPLRERRTEIPYLSAKILRELGELHPRAAPQMTPGAMTALQAYDWPGNMRELRDVLVSLVMSAGLTIEADDVERVIGGRAADHHALPANSR